METIIQKTADYFGIKIEIIKGHTNHRKNLGRMLAIYLGKHISQMTYNQIAKNFEGIDSRGIGSSLRRCALLLNKNEEVKNAMAMITDALHKE